MQRCSNIKPYASTFSKQNNFKQLTFLKLIDIIFNVQTTLSIDIYYPHWAYVESSKLSVQNIAEFVSLSIFSMFERR